MEGTNEMPSPKGSYSEISGLETSETAVSLIPSVIGFFAMKRGKVVDHVLFPKDVGDIAKSIRQTRKGELVDELCQLVGRLKEEGYRKFRVEYRELARALKNKFGIDVETAKTDDGKILRRSLPTLAQECGFVRDRSDFRRILRGVSLEVATIATKEALEESDLLVIHSVHTLANITKTVNVLVSNVREWYGLHFPELVKVVEGNESFVRLVSEIGRREGFSDADRLSEIGIASKKAKKIARVARRSMGVELSDVDLERIQDLCRCLNDLFKVRGKISRYIRGLMERIAPNITILAGPLLGAKLIASAGGLENLAKMPSSRIQILGAERALFRALKTGEGVPKHGIIFQHSVIHSAKKKRRGKIARKLASKLAIAARADAFSSRYIGDELKTRVNELVREVEEGG